MHTENSKNIIGGDVNTNGGDVRIGDVNKTVNYYLLENESIKELTNKLKDINEKLNKEGIDADFKQHLEQQKYELHCEYEKWYKAIEKAYHDVLEFGFTNEELQELQQLFLEGKHQQLEDVVNPKAIEESIKTRSKANKKDANKLLILAKSKAIQFEDEDRFEKTVEYFELSLKADRNEENLFYYAYFLQQEGKHKQAISYNEEVVEIVEKLIPTNKKKFSLFLSRTKQNLASSQYELLLIKEAEKSLDESRKILNRLNQDFEESYIIDIGLNLIDIGFLYNKKNEFAKSDDLYNNALKVFKPLAKLQPELHSILSAEVFSKLGELKFDEGVFLNSKGDSESVTRKISDAKKILFKIISEI